MIDQIDLDRYSQANSNIESAEQPAPDSMVGHQLVPVQLLRELMLSGEITVGQLTVAGVSAQNVVIPILANGGKVEVTDARADLYTGSFNTTASFDVQGDEPLLTIASNLNGVNVEPLLQDYTSQTAAVTGNARINIDVLSRGLNRQQLLERANGAVSALITEGTISGIDISAELERASGVELDDSINNVADTSFSELSISAVLADGVLQSDDLVFTSPLLSMTGEGGVNMVRQTVDYLLHLTVGESSESEPVDLGGLLQELAGIELSVPVQGPFGDLSIDFKSILQNAFDSNPIEQIKDSSLDEQNAEVLQRIETEKAALRDRLEKEREDAAALIRENKQLTQEQLEIQERELKLQLEREKDALKEKLQDNLKKGIKDLIGEN